MLGLYVHVPFCSAICNYCNFNRGLFDESLKTRYLTALLQEIHTAPPSQFAPSAPLAPPEADTLYFGGGTPSLLEPREVESVIAACGDTFGLTADAEITLEANPESVDTSRLS